MHFWIGERASQYHHHGRRQRPPLYSGQFFGTGFGGRRGDKPFGQWNRRPSSSIAASNVNANPQQQSSSSSTIASTSNIPSSSTGTGTSMVTPVHRFQTLGQTATSNSNSNSNTQDRLTVGGAGGPVGDLSPNSRARGDPSSGYYGNASRYQQRSRSRDRQHENNRSNSVDHNDRQRRRRSSSSRRYRDRNSNSVGSNDGTAGGNGNGGGVTTSSTNSELRDSSFSSSEQSTPDCTRTKRIGLTLCFMGFILLCTVGAKFVIEGPGIIDISRREKSETTAYFFLTELIFVAFAMALFFTGVACLRKRTNDYLLRQFNQHILHGSSNQRGISDDLSNSEILYDPIIITTVGDNPEHPPVVERNSLRASYPHPSYGLSSITTPINHNCLCRHSPSHHSYHHHHHHLSSVFGPSTTLGHMSRHGHGHGHTHHHGNGGSRRCPYLTSNSAAILMQRQQPPPYHIALYLPLPSTTAATGAATAGSAGTTTPGHSSVVAMDSCQIIEEVIGRDRDSCSVSLNKEDGSTGTSEGDIPPKESGSGQSQGQVKEEGDERLTSPETPPPSYEQFFLRL